MYTYTCVPAGFVWSTCHFCHYHHPHQDSWVPSNSSCSFLLWALLTGVRQSLQHALIRRGVAYSHGLYCHQGIGRLLFPSTGFTPAPLPNNQGGAFARWLIMYQGWKSGVGSLGCSLGARSTAPASLPTWWDGTYSILQKLPVPSWDRDNRVGGEYTLCYVKRG